MSSDAAIEVRGLHKSYGDFEAVRGIDITVSRGEVFGLLGPNGAGKTTTVEILEGYRERSAGEVLVLGHDPGRRERALQKRIGIVLQSACIRAGATWRKCSHSSAWRRRATPAHAHYRAASCAGSTSLWRSSATPS